MPEDEQQASAPFAFPFAKNMFSKQQAIIGNMTCVMKEIGFVRENNVLLIERNLVNHFEARLERTCSHNLTTLGSVLMIFLLTPNLKLISLMALRPASSFL